MIRRIGIPVVLVASLLLAWHVNADEPPLELQLLAAEIARGEHPGIEGIAAIRNGEVLAQGQTGKLGDKGLDIRSATKSVTALLVGIAIDRGAIASVQVPVIELLPEYAESLADDPRKAQIRVEDLLTMRSGLDCDDWTKSSPGHEDKMYRRRDWLEFWAKQPMRDDPGTRYSYCTGNVVALGRILANTLDQPVPEFARAALFEPLGIEHAQWETWNRGRDTDTGGHLAIHPGDLLRIGQVVMAGGTHQGRELISASWIEAMTTAHVAIPDRAQHYGYLWWLDQARGSKLPPTRVWMAIGNGGNLLFLLPEHDFGVVFAGTRFNRPDAMEPMAWLRDRILPAEADERGW